MSTRPLSVKRLAAFRAVLKTGSVTTAAHMLNISQPAITKTVRQLEEELGLSLFLRVRGRLIPTPEAVELLPEIERLFGNVAAVRNLSDEIRDGFSGSLAVATVTTLSASLVSRTLARFHSRYPKVRFNLNALSTRHVVDAVVSRQADLGIVDVPSSAEDLEVIDLCQSEVGCVVPKTHPLAQRKRLGPADVAGKTLISFSEETLTGWQLRNAFKDARVNARITFTVNNAHTAYALVQSGAGIAIVDVFPMLTGVFRDLTILPFRPAIETNPHVIFSRAHAVPVVARNFSDMLAQTMQELVTESHGLLKLPPHAHGVHPIAESR